MAMASSNFMASRSPPNQNSGVHLLADQGRGFGSMNIDDFLRNVHSDTEEADDGGEGRSKAVVEDVWREIVSEGGGGGGIGEPGMTLEDFLAKAGAVNEEDVRVPAMPPPGGFVMEAATAALMSPAGGRGKRTAVEQMALDRATQQKQRRMIKNRESAARSRERKQAYNLELESLVSHLEEENERLLKEEDERKKKRYKLLVENVIPVVEMRKPQRVMKRARSV